MTTDLKYLSEQILSLSVREAIQLGALLLAGAGVTSGTSADADSNDLVLMATGSQKINVIKLLREFTNLGLKEAKDMAESAPQVVLRGVPRHTAEAARQRLIEVGASVDIRPG